MILSVCGGVEAWPHLTMGIIEVARAVRFADTLSRDGTAAKIGNALLMRAER